MVGLSSLLLSKFLSVTFISIPINISHKILPLYISHKNVYIFFSSIALLLCLNLLYLFTFSLLFTFLFAEKADYKPIIGDVPSDRGARGKEGKTDTKSMVRSNH